MKEITAYVKCYGPYILPIYGWCLEPCPPTTIRVLIIMEYMSKGSLTRVLQNECAQLTFRKKDIIAYQVACGMNRIHRHGMIHRDIRPDNILIDDSYSAKIGDMGITQSYHYYFGFLGKPMGCIRYMPPEFHWNLQNEKLDIYIRLD